MNKTSLYFLFGISFLCVVWVACKKQPSVPSPILTPPGDTSAVPLPNPNPLPNGVNVDLTKVPYQKLSEYGFFTGTLKDQQPASSVIPYEPASSLFTDYALKKRFVWLPSRTKAQFVAVNKPLELPTGSVLIKTFYYDNVQPLNNTRVIETRLMIKKAGGWVFAEYVWNDEQTEAYLQMNGSYTPISWLQNNTPKTTTYRIPSQTECFTCHKFNNEPVPIGIKPQNLNTLYNYGNQNANQLQYWIDKRILGNNIPSGFESAVDYNDLSQPLKTRLRSYLDINCGHCHQENSHCDYRPLRLAFSETSLSANMGVCITPDENINASLLKIIVPGNFTKSVMHFRLNSTDESTRMPLLGRTIVHEEGLQLLKDYIMSITNCD
jgi:uncharacterized repeat protein (TIGR03806 family)